MPLWKDSFLELYYLSTVCLRTKELLAEYLARDGKLPGEGVSYLATFTLSHIDDMHDGFKWTLRASEADVEELQYLVRQAGIYDWNSQDSSDLWRERNAIPPDLRKIQAVQHAKVVMGILPRMPSEAVTFPSRRSYSDIAVPGGPAEFANRIDELERAVWDTASRKTPQRLDHNSYRRAYGFFDAASWLANQQLRLFDKSGPDDSSGKRKLD